MKRLVLYAWELGGGMGHINGFLPVAHSLKEQFDCVVQFCTKSSEFAREKVASFGFQYYEAPSYSVSYHSGPLLGHADILQNAAGFLNGVALYTSLRNWLSVFDSVKPSVVVGDFAPLAMLAAKIAEIPRVAFDTGFFSPPTNRPFPVFNQNSHEGSHRLRAIEGQVVSTVNSVIRRLGGVEINEFCDLFSAESRILNNYADLDVYQRESREEFVGPIFPSAYKYFRNKPKSNSKTRAFVYLNASCPHTREIVRCLSELPLESIIYIGGATTVYRNSIANLNVEILSVPVAMEQCLPEVDFVVCHGGVGTINIALHFGKPIIVFPMYTEQSMNANALERIGLGIGVHDLTQFKNAVSNILKNRATHTSASRFAETRRAADPAAVAGKVAALFGEYKPSLIKDASVNNLKFDRIFRSDELDVVYLHENIPNAEIHWERLLDISPRAFRVEKMSKTSDTYAAASSVARTDRFITVDANVLVDSSFFGLSTEVPTSEESSVWSWPSINEINGQTCHSEGIQLWSKSHVELISSSDKLALDMSDNAGLHQAWIRRYAKPFCRTLHKASSFCCFCAGYKQATFLLQGKSVNTIPIDKINTMPKGWTARRLASWLTVGTDLPNGYWAIFGARLAVLHFYNADLPNHLQDRNLFDLWKETKDKSDTLLINAIHFLGASISEILGPTIIEDWTPERSLNFKQALTRKYNALGVFTCLRQLPA